jgi:hypothetical protein
LTLDSLYLLSLFDVIFNKAFLKSRVHGLVTAFFFMILILFLPSMCLLAGSDFFLICCLVTGSKVDVGFVKDQEILGYVVGS